MDKKKWGRVLPWMAFPVAVVTLVCLSKAAGGEFVVYGPEGGEFVGHQEVAYAVTGIAVPAVWAWLMHKCRTRWPE